MGMDLTVYVGPYFVVSKYADFHWCDFDEMVCDGRMEAGAPGDDWILIPNRDLDGVEREMRFGRFDDLPVTQINPAMIVSECAAFARLAEPLIKHCDDNQIEIKEAWGVVPRWA